jgi:hypothetical protein
LRSTCLEKNDLAVATANNYFVSGHSLYRFYSFCTCVYVECKNLVLDLETHKISARSSRKQKVLFVLAVSQAGVISNKSTRVYYIVVCLTSLWVQLPKRHFLVSSYCELIVGGITTLVVFSIATPCQTFGSLCKDLWQNRKGTHNMTVGGVPDEHLAIQSVSTADE